MLVAWVDCWKLQDCVGAGEQVLRILPEAHGTLNNLTLRNRIKAKIHNMVRTSSLNMRYFQQNSDDSSSYPYLHPPCFHRPNLHLDSLNVSKSLLKYCPLCMISINHLVLKHSFSNTCNSDVCQSMGIQAVELGGYHF